MAVQLFGNPYQLQGSQQNLQGSTPALQGSMPVLQGGSPVVQAAPQPKPVIPAARPAAPKPVVRAATPAPKQTASPWQIAPQYTPYVGTRASRINPGVLEFFNPENNMGFSNERDVLNHILTRTGQNLQSLEQLKGSPVSVFGGAQGLETYQDPNQSMAESFGRAGIGYDEYLKYLEAQSGLSEVEKNEIKKSLGIDTLEASVFAPPSKSTEQLYNDAYGMAGLAELKTQIKAKMDELNSRQSAYTSKAGDINENPFLSEASRIGRIKRLDDRRLADVGNLENEVNSLKDLYNAGVNEVNALVTRQSTDFVNNRTLDQQKLSYLLSKVEEQIGAKQAAKTAENYKYLPDYLKAKAKSQKPDTIGSNETGYYRWNPDTATFEQVIAPQITPNFQTNPVTGELFDTKTGRPGGAGVGGLNFSQNAPAGGFRTDRHNNPTAFTTDIAKQAGLREGVDYVVGDPFPNNPNLRTAKLLGDPIAQTIQVIDRIGFYTQGGQQRWTHTAIPQSQWNAMSYDQKAQVVAQMYQKEGGTGVLVGGGGNDIVATLAQQVMQNPALLQSLPSAQQTAVIARLAQMGAQVPGKPLSAEASKLAGIVQTLPNEIEQLKNAFRSDYKGSLVGITTGTNRELVKLLDQVADKVGRLRSGGAINKDEETRFKRQIASFMDIPFGNANNAIAALDGVLAEARTVAQGIQPGSQPGVQMPSGYPASNVNLSDLNFAF